METVSLGPHWEASFRHPGTVVLIVGGFLVTILPVVEGILVDVLLPHPPSFVAHTLTKPPVYRIYDARPRRHPFY
jgi:hypothetical protein